MHTPISTDEERAGALWQADIDVAQRRWSRWIMKICQVLDKNFGVAGHSSLSFRW